MNWRKYYVPIDYNTNYNSSADSFLYFTDCDQWCEIKLDITKSNHLLNNIDLSFQVIIKNLSNF